MRRVSVACLLFVALAVSVSTPVAGVTGTSSASTNASNPHAAATNATIGYFNGYWYNQSIDVNQSDGLNKSERVRYVSITMARVEHIRGKNFKHYVPVQVIPRSQYQGNQSISGNATFNEWNDQVWQALWIVGEDTNSSAALSAFYGSNVLGFYDPSSDSIKLITNNPNDVYFDNATLAHELTHALQDQYYNLSREKYNGRTQDAQLSTSGLVEGEAKYVEKTYAQDCGKVWSCPANPPGASSGGGGGNINFGVQWVVYFPYADGPGYVASLKQHGGWAAVDNAWKHPPNASSDIIHHSDRQPVNVSFRDEATGGWSTFPDQGVHGSDTAGEASIYAMFWYQSYKYGANVISPGSLYQNQGPYDSYNYTSAPSAGWAGDKIVPYKNPNGGQNGYVWVTQWQTKKDAQQFVSAYEKVLQAHKANQVSANTWVVSGNDPFADAYRLHVNGTRVTVVNGPDVHAVNQIRPSLANAGGSDETGTSATGGSSTQSTQGSSPGFAVTSAVAALVASAFLVRWRR